MRHPNWDYSHKASYFITLVVKGRKPLLGKINKGVVELSPLGKIVQERWLASEVVYPNVSLDEYVIMPDHFHAILHFSSKHLITDTKVQDLSTVVRGFKSTVMKQARAHGLDIRWQRSFHDRIIRSERQLINTRRYVKENPKRS